MTSTTAKDVERVADKLFEIVQRDISNKRMAKLMAQAIKEAGLR